MSLTSSVTSGLKLSHSLSGSNVSGNNRTRTALRLSFVFASCFALAFVAGSLTFIPKPSHADETADSEVSIQITPSIASALSPNTLALPINPTPTGQEAKGELSIDVSTNNQTGYNLTMSTTSAVTALMHTDGISTIPTVTNATAGIPNALANNTWGYNIGQASATTTFLSTPALGSATQLKETTAPAQSSTTTITIGAKATTAIPAGSYANTLLFTAAANPVPFPTIASISPNANPVAGDALITITGANFVAPTNVTIGGAACTSVTVVSDTTITCISPSNTLGTKTVTISTANGMATKADAFTYMLAVQEFSAPLCADLEPGVTIQRIDSRDNVVYRIRKMVDGKCWFIDNLAFEPPTDSSAPGYIAFDPAITLDGSSTDDKAQYAQNNNNPGEGQIPNNGNPIPSYLYNWCAALGDTSEDCSASAGAGSYQTVIGGVVQSGSGIDQPEVTGICPAPFRLPKGGPEAESTTTPNTANEFVILDIAMGGTGTNRTPANTYGNWLVPDEGTSSSWSGVLSGLFLSILEDQGSGGHWWSSTATSSSMLTYYLHLYGSSPGIGPANGTFKYYGFAVRCVL